MRMIVAWGSRGYIGPLYPREEAPEWAKTAASRMFHMGVDILKINEVLKEMRDKKFNNTYKMEDGREYVIIFD